MKIFILWFTLVKVYFPPGCEPIILDLIDNSKETINIQCYSFSSKPIVDALVRAKQRGVKIQIIVCHTRIREFGSRIYEAMANDIYVRVDANHAIAHNKIIIVDNQTVITGSYNFSYSAEHHNAENMLILTRKEDGDKVINDYIRNFDYHSKHAKIIP